MKKIDLAALHAAADQVERAPVPPAWPLVAGHTHR